MGPREVSLPEHCADGAGGRRDPSKLDQPKLLAIRDPSRRCHVERPLIQSVDPLPAAIDRFKKLDRQPARRGI